MEDKGAEIVIVGANQRSSLASVRERLFVEETAAEGVLMALCAAGIGQAILLSTCDRVEVQAAADDPDTAAEAIRDVLAAQARMTGAALRTQIYNLHGAEALRHLFAVASSLDSSTIGEPQVLGQIKAAHRLAKDRGLVGAALENALQSAYRCAKKVRSQTTIGQRPVSIAASALTVAGEIHGDLTRARVAVIGTGEMGALLAEHLIRAGVSRTTVLYAHARRAESVANRLGCHHAVFGGADAARDGEGAPAPTAADLAATDIVVCSLGMGRGVLDVGVVAELMRLRRQRPLFIVDAAVPNDVDPSVAQMDGVFLYSLEDLEMRAHDGIRAREEESRLAWSIVGRAVNSHMRNRSARTAAPSVGGLRRRFEAVRLATLADLGEAGRSDAVRGATRLLVNRLLHAPSRRLLDLAADDRGRAHEIEKALSDVFQLDERETGNDSVPDTEAGEESGS